uniref:Cation_ATPase_N domain-containing protein n=1 Tax=Macrostomum lignano TaxID=282301 RepID=A0A1I8F483_9PLAT
DQYGQLFVHDVQMMTKSGARVRLLRRSRAGLNQCLPDEHATDETTGSATPLLDPFSEDSLTRYFFHKKLKYVWNSDQQLFVKIEVFVDTPCSFFHHTAGLTESDAARHRVRFGENRVNIPLTPIPKLFAVKALHPFYLFQLFSVILWFNDEYEMYASCIVVISLLSLSLSVFETARTTYPSTRTCSYPGDVIEIPKGGCVMQCDAVLVSGNCIVNESMLTGESVPVLKTPLSAAESGPISTRDHNKNVLFCGTHVIQTRFKAGRVRAVVLRTGFATAKGEMVRSILFPKPIEFKFNKDIVHYLIVLSLFALAGFIYTIVLMLHRDYPVGKIMLRALDLITIIVPPALPAAMTVGIVFAQTRLRKANIFCIAPNTINISGGLNAVCFDKTGTLTEDGLDLWGVVPVEERRFQPQPGAAQSAVSIPSAGGMAVCHTLTRIRGELSGDPLDLKMFQGTRWVLEEPEQDDYRKFDQLVSTVVRPPGSEPVDNIDSIDPDRLPYQLGIIRQFPFSSSLQRMSVVARRLGADHFTAYVKGSPEMVQALSRPDSLPDRFSEQLLHYTRQGYRVLALAYKPLRVSYLK